MINDHGFPAFKIHSGEILVILNAPAAVVEWPVASVGLNPARVEEKRPEHLFDPCGMLF